MKTLVIAECGSCHDGELRRALDLIEVVRKAGADVAKFQFWSSADRLADRRHANDYRGIYRHYQVPPGWLPLLKEACDTRSHWTVGLRPIEFMVTTYLAEDVFVVAPFVKRFKVASFEAQDASFIYTHPGDRDIVVSLGMADRIPEHLSDGKRTIRLLHCVSAYPAPTEAMNLAVLRGDWGEPWDPAPSPFVGLSDHSRHPWMGALAVAAGAQILEAHIRLDTTPESNPDYATAFTPSEFAEYIRNVRFTESAMGTGEKRMHPSEADMARYRVQA